MSRCVSEEQGIFVLYLRSDVLLRCFCFFLFVFSGGGRARICSVPYFDEGYRMNSPSNNDFFVQIEVYCRLGL